jgi:hypothetical protein
MARVVDTFFNNTIDTPPVPLTVQTRFYPMLYMINHPQTRLEYLTAASLKGFMVTLSCNDPLISQYTDLFDTNKKIDWYLLKFVVVTPYETDLDPFTDKKQNKIETEISYEAILISFEKIKATIYIKNNEKFILINERGDISLSKLI